MIAPLDWGLGHATRCVPIIHYLIEKGACPVIAADGRPLAFLRKEFPQLEFITLPGYNISYPSSGSMTVKMLASIPRIIGGINEEHYALRQIIKEYKIDAVISDNRFGLWSKEVPCIFITHQLMVKSPLAEGLLHRLNKSYIQKYSECWIPDTEGEDNLSGDLSHEYRLPSNAHFIGTLSRFENLNGTAAKKEKIELLVLLSGPEPQRTIFERTVEEQLKRTGQKTTIVQGRPEASKITSEGNITYIPHADTVSLFELISAASLIISRPGYSTVMDLSVLGKKAIFVPTPGQTEQEYLGELMMKKGIAYSVAQKSFDLEKAIKESNNYKGFSRKTAEAAYKERIDLLLEKLRPSSV